MSVNSAVSIANDDQPPHVLIRGSKQFGGSTSTLGRESHSLQLPDSSQHFLNVCFEDNSNIGRRRSIGGADPVLESSRALRKISEALGMSLSFHFHFIALKRPGQCKTTPEKCVFTLPFKKSLQPCLEKAMINSKNADA